YPKTLGAGTRKLHGDVVGPLKSRFEIDDRQDNDVVLAGRRDLAIGIRRAQAFSHKLMDLVRNEIQNLRERQVIPFQARLRRPLPARQQRVCFSKGEHDLPGALRSVQRQLSLELDVELLAALGKSSP